MKINLFNIFCRPRNDPQLAHLPPSPPIPQIGERQTRPIGMRKPGRHYHQEGGRDQSRQLSSGRDSKGGHSRVGGYG